MKSRVRKTYFLVAIAISFLVAVCPAYQQYNDLIEIDCLSPHPSFENLDPDNFLADVQNKGKLFVLDSSPEIILLAVFFGEPNPHFFARIFSLNQPISILRC
jgi:hypothetical protein